MPAIVAKKTLLAIERALRSDQGAKFRSLLRANINACDDAFDGEEKGPFRSHLGASGLGRDCPRQIWYDFRWATVQHHIGRTILLFNRGHMEEGRFVTLLQMIGMKVWQVDDNGHQYRISGHGGHYGSAIDGVGKNCPDMPEVPLMLEFKTSNTKNFKKMEKEGVREAKPEHFVQFQQYMGKYNIKWTLYMVICKETDELYAELIEFEPETYERYHDRAGNIIFSDSAPIGIANSPGAWGCKFCSHKDVCHNGEAPARNCRTCKYSKPMPDGTWFCRNYEVELTKEMQQWQKAECDGYEVF